MELQPKKRFSDANREDILTYLEAGGMESNIVLSFKQEELLDRWKFADEKLRENKYKREQIAKFIIAKYNVSRDTAFKDIINAEYVFSSSYPLNKRYLVGLRIEFLINKINEAFIDKDALTAAQLEKVLQKYIDIYPDYVPPRSPKQIILNIQNNILAVNMSAEEAFNGAEDIAKRLEDNEDY